MNHKLSDSYHDYLQPPHIRAADKALYTKSYVGYLRQAFRIILGRESSGRSVEKQDSVGS